MSPRGWRRPPPTEPSPSGTSARASRWPLKTGAKTASQAGAVLEAALDAFPDPASERTTGPAELRQLLTDMRLLESAMAAASIPGDFVMMSATARERVPPDHRRRDDLIGRVLSSGQVDAVRLRLGLRRRDAAARMTPSERSARAPGAPVQVPPRRRPPYRPCTSTPRRHTTSTRSSACSTTTGGQRAGS